VEELRKASARKEFYAPEENATTEGLTGAPPEMDDRSVRQAESRRNYHQQRNGRIMNISRSAKFLAAAAILSASALLAQSGNVIATGTFHGAAHSTSGRATVYAGPNGENTLRITHFKTSNGPDVHVVLIAASDAQDNENFLDKKIERLDLGKLKGNEGDQNYTIPSGTDLSKYKAVSIYCERFNANFGTAPLEN
jgi:hypothetical protein